MAWLGWDRDIGGLLFRIPLPPATVSEGMGRIPGSGSNAVFGLPAPLDGSVTRQNLSALEQAGLGLIEWEGTWGVPASVTKILYEASKSGIWNRVDLSGDKEKTLFRFVVSNPHIAHSRREPHFSFSLLDSRQDAVPPYGRTAPLPGIPLGRLLGDPVHLLLYLKRFGQKKVVRWCLRKDGKSAYVRGEHLQFFYRRPADLPGGYLDEICRMIEAGGTVTMKWVRRNLERAFLIGYVMEEGIIVANSSLKHPRVEYVEKVKAASGLDLSGYLERGYTSVRPEYRGMGIGTRILEGLTARVGERKVFSIIGSDNTATQKIALRNRTRQVAAFYSESLGKEVGIWIPEWMVAP
jgi:GNAT superfamily N-acetyltransferase